MRTGRNMMLGWGLVGSLSGQEALGVVRVSDYLKERKVYRDSLCLVVSHEQADTKDASDSPTRVDTPVACRFNMKASLNLHKKFKDEKDPKKKEALIRSDREKKYPFPGAEKSFVIPYQEARLVCFDFSKDMKELPRGARIRDYVELDTACVRADKADEALDGFKEEKDGVFSWNTKAGSLDGLAL